MSDSVLLWVAFDMALHLAGAAGFSAGLPEREFRRASTSSWERILAIGASFQRGDRDSEPFKDSTVEAVVGLGENL